MKAALAPWIAFAGSALLGACSFGSERDSGTSRVEAEPGKSLVMFIADNQEHLLTGQLLQSNGPVSESWVTSVAQRSPLANVGGSLLMRRALQHGRQAQAGLVVHLGDAADISCPDELQIAFDALETEAPGGWLLAPGNHDGLMAGTFSSFQPELPLADLDPGQVYPRAPNAAEYADTSWRHACASPDSINDRSRTDVLTKSDVIAAYADRLKRRPGATVTRLPPENVRIESTDVTCTVEKITLPAFGYQAIARICPRTPVRAGDSQWVGPWAGYIVQAFKVADASFLLLDTSSYLNPNLANVGLKGSASPDQRDAAAGLAAGVERSRLIIAGHHPFDSLDSGSSRWVADHADRYMSAHAHKAANIAKRRGAGEMLTELNIGSTLDHPAQALLFDASGSEPKVRVLLTGADADGTPGFAPECEQHRGQWSLAPAEYRSYRGRPYVQDLLSSLRAASAKAPGDVPTIPGGDATGDWATLADALKDIRGSEGQAQSFWACQAAYASEATRRENSAVERALNRLHLGFEPGETVGPGWQEFRGP